jgi:Rrf2 family transcriptional regulator, cysteine metabolism repressor
MLITQKMQYALRAIYELARRYDQGPLKTAQIAETQAIPVRFLEVILNHLKRADLVAAKRGYYGGYQLTRPPGQITVEDIFQGIGETSEPITCVSCASQCNCPFYGDCAFMPLWDELQRAIEAICKRTTIQMLLDNRPAAAPLTKALGMDLPADE